MADETQDNFEVRNGEAEKALRSIADNIQGMVPAGMGFTLLLFDFGKGGNMFYMSSADRKTMIEAMKEFISKNDDDE